MDATFNYLKCPVFNNNKQHETHKETESVAFTLWGGGEANKTVLRNLRCRT